MNLQKNYFLLIFSTIVFGFFSILISIPLFSIVDINPWALWDTISLLFVNIAACFLFMVAFGHIKKSNLKLFYYKLIWIQEILIILGFLGLGVGFIFMVLGMLIPPLPGVDPTAKLVSSMAIALITVVYGFIGAVVYYLIQKYYELKENNNEEVKIIVPKEGLHPQSIFYFMLFIGSIVLSSYFGAADAGVGLKSMITFDALIFVICLNIIFILLYRGNYFIMLKNIFWYSTDSEQTIKYNLKFIRNIKKISSMILSLILIITPIIILASLAMPPQIHEHGTSHAMLMVIINTLIYYNWIILIIIMLNVIEAREVGKLYCKTGVISSGNRFYVITYIVPPAIVLYILLIITVYWTTLF